MKEQKKIVFVTMFTRLENVHLIKDVGMIPYILHRDYGMDSRMVTFRNEKDYPYIKREVKGLKIEFIKKGRIPLLSGARYIWSHAPSIDVLNVYHLNLSSFVYLLLYRLRRGRKRGIAYLKLDMDLNGYKRLFGMNPAGFVKKRTMELADLISVETTLLCKALQKRYGSKVIYIPNGFYDMPEERKTSFEKEDIILTVGKLGTYAKATDTLLSAFAGAAGGNSSWKLVLVGTVEEEFRPYVDNFFKRHADLRDRIIFTGPVNDRKKLMELYARAKIFILPSRSESFGISMLEAAANGCFLVTTTAVPAGRDIYQDGRFGYIVPPDDIAALSGACLRLMNSRADWNLRAAEISDIACHDFRWEPIVARLNEALRGLSR